IIFVADQAPDDGLPTRDKYQTVAAVLDSCCNRVESRRVEQDWPPEEREHVRRDVDVAREEGGVLGRILCGDDQNARGARDSLEKRAPRRDGRADLLTKRCFSDFSKCDG